MMEKLMLGPYREPILQIGQEKSIPKRNLSFIGQLITTFLKF